MRKRKEKGDKSGIKIKLVEKLVHPFWSYSSNIKLKKHKRCSRNDSPVFLGQITILFLFDVNMSGVDHIRKIQLHRMTSKCGDLYIETTTRSAYVRGNKDMKESRSKNKYSNFRDNCKQSAKKFQIDVIETFK